MSRHARDFYFSTFHNTTGDKQKNQVNVGHFFLKQVCFFYKTWSRLARLFLVF